MLCSPRDGSRGSLSSSLRSLAYPLTVFFVLLIFAVPSFCAVTFTRTKIASGDTSSNSIVSGDFDNDGILDLVTCNATTLSFYKGLGAGKYAAPVNTPFSGGGATLQAVAADFNGDGKLDLAVASFYNGTSILVGNGNGTFTLHTSMTNGESVTTLIALADFNGDHIPDLVMNDCPTHSIPCTLQVYLGKGDGSFTQSSTLQYGGNAAFVTGDFNVDGHEDIAALTPQIGGVNGITLYFGEGNGQFQSPVTYTTPGISSLIGLAAGDFYNNRIQSLALATETYDSSTGNFSMSVQSVQYSSGAFSATQPQPVSTYPSSVNVMLAAGDLDGDFKDDLVISGAYGTNSRIPISVYLLGTGTGTFRAATSLPTSGRVDQTPFIRDLNLDSRHDIGLDWSTDNSAGGGAFLLRNTKAAVNCTPPTPNKLSVRVCSPTSGESVGGSFTFQAAGNAFNGTVKRIEVWIDGKKVGQNLEDQLNVTISLTPGTHTAGFIVIDSFDNSASGSVTFTSSGGTTCPAPPSPGVNVCSPTQNENVSSPVNFVASGTGASGKVDHLELWIDGQKIGNYPGAKMNANVPRSSGSHQATIVEVDFNFNFVKSAPVSFTVK